ncbi:MAG: c-type cytochrome [Nitrospira sp.]|nr:c-type cytochrome [Nitrospira sp.]
MDGSLGWRKWLLGGLVACFAIQTILVYSDDTGERTPPLSEYALKGRAVWLKHNCQTCHQLYGFGGFLGPDLTNAAPRLDRGRVFDLLKNGYGQMPAFQLEDDEIENVLIFLHEINETGYSQPRATVAPDPSEFHGIVAAMEVPGPAAAGRDLFNERCAACHTPLADLSLGAFVAPDPTRIAERLSDQEILEVLTKGRPERGMPNPALGEEQKAHVLAWFKWMTEHRPELAEKMKPRATAAPWFEYER